MPKNREKQKLNKKVGQMEERLNAKTEWDIKDPTPVQMVESINGTWNGIPTSICKGIVKERGSSVPVIEYV